MILAFIMNNGILGKKSPKSFCVATIRGFDVGANDKALMTSGSFVRMKSLLPVSNGWDCAAVDDELTTGN